MAKILIEHLTKSFSTGAPAVNDVSMEVRDGEFVVLVGPSGSGKTTLLRMIAGLEAPTSGKIVIGDRDVGTLPPRDRDIAMVFQNYALYPHLSVRRNIGYGLRVRGAKKPQIDARVNEVATLLGLGGLLDRRPSQLSGGQKQRVAMGRAIAREPQVYLMDEPLSNLDAKLRVKMRAELARLHARLGVTSVYVTHDQVEAMTLGQRVAVMRNGSIEQVDVPRVLYHEPVNLYVATFVGSPAMNLVEASVANGIATFAGVEIRLDAATHDGGGGTVILGLRPEAFETAAFADAGLPQLEAIVEVVEELGADMFVFFSFDAPRVRVDPGIAADDGDGDASILADGRQLFCARVDARTKVGVGGRIRLAVRPAYVHVFDATTGRRVSLARERRRDSA